jgi:hypothetical protein
LSSGKKKEDEEDKEPQPGGPTDRSSVLFLLSFYLKMEAESGF